MTMFQRLIARVRDVNSLNNQITNMSWMLVDKDKKKMLKQENEELKRLMDKYAHNLQLQVKEPKWKRIQIQDQHQRMVAKV